METRFLVTIVILCALWYSVGSGCSVLSKIILQIYGYPVTVAMASILSISFYSIPLERRMNTQKSRPISLAYRFKFMLPISIGKAVAMTFSQFGLSRAAVSYVHTVKATMPLFAVLTARLLLGERQPWRVYMSLVPICMGVMIATATELSFDTIGMLSALMSTFTYSIMNTLAKRIYRDTNINPITLLRDTAQLAALMMLPFWCLTDAPRIYDRIATQQVATADTPLIGWHFLQLLMAGGALSFLQNVFAFILIRKLAPVSYAVANTVKRIVVIGSSLLLLRNPVSGMNVLGMLMAILGVFIYNRVKSSVKHAADDEEDHRMKLPTVMTRSTLSDASFLTTYPSLNDDSSFATLPTGGGTPYRRVTFDDLEESGGKNGLYPSGSSSTNLRKSARITFADEKSIQEV